MTRRSILPHLRDIFILPFTVTCVVPYLIFTPRTGFIPENLPLKLIGGVVLLSGLCLFFYTVYLFGRIGKGTLAPWSVKQKLVVTGPYRYCRNPMITGVFFILIAESLILASSSILIWAGVFFCINTIYFIVSEEPGLEARFGDDYRHYKREVPRWLPRFTPYQQS